MTATRTARLLAEPGLSLAEHRRTYPLPTGVRRGGSRVLIELIDQAGLRGRGGAAFPTAVKMTSVVNGKGTPVVVVNGTEGEPTSAKDKVLLTAHPHLVLDGALWAAAAVGAQQVHLAVERGNSRAVAAITHAINERRSAGEQGVSVGLHELPAHYVAGEESALVQFLNGGEAKPTALPPRPFERGVRGRPTLVNNAETLAHLTQIATYGSEWYRSVGTAEEPGTALVTFTGGPDGPLVIEVPFGAPIRAVAHAAGGCPGGLQALLVGGYYGTWITADQAAAAEVSNASLRPLGANVGCGALVALPERACGLRETARVLTWMAGETAGQCGPCVNGLAAMASELQALANGRATPGALDRLHRWAGQVEGRGACKFPDGAVRLLRSALTVFANDIAEHAVGVPCADSLRPGTLPVPNSEGLPWR